MDIKITKFKTNINCPHCLAKVTPVLNAMSEIDHWHVELENPDKTLTIEGNISPELVVQALKDAGYQAETL